METQCAVLVETTWYILLRDLSKYSADQERACTSFFAGAAHRCLEETAGWPMEVMVGPARELPGTIH